MPRRPPPDRKLVWILAAGLALRLGAALYVGQTPPEGDAKDYVAIAGNLAASGDFAIVPGTPTARRPPLYPAFLAPFFLLPAPLLAARLAQAILDTATCCLIYAFGLAALRRHEALVAAGLYSFNPVFIAYATNLITETLFFFIWGAAFVLLLDLSERPSARRAARAGLALGLSILCRPVTILFPPLAAGALWLAGRGGQARLKALALAAGVAYLCLVPWFIRNLTVMGWPVPVSTGSGASFWIGSQAHTMYPDWQGTWSALARNHDDYGIDAEFKRLTREAWRDHWREIALDLPKRLGHFWLTSHSAMFGLDRPLGEYRARGRWGAILTRAALWALHLALLSLGFYGLWSLRRDWGPAHALILAAFLYCTLHIFIDYIPNRYHLPAWMFWLVLSARGATRLWDLAARKT